MSTPTSHVFKALGHPTRLHFIKLLGDGEKCVCELVDSVDQGWSTVSRHLSLLKEAGIVSDEKRGLQVFYRISLPCVTQFIACLEQDNDRPDSKCACE